jgi:UTP--glucose-1-phosphate uridylyltransferase
MDVFNRYQESVVALEEVDPSLVSRYGMIGGHEIEGSVFLINQFIEKPELGKSPSNLAIASRYIFTPEIFDYLENVKPGKNDEIQLTDAMQMMLKDRVMYGLRFDGVRHDIGNKLDFLKTNVVFGLKSNEFSVEFKQWLKELVAGF